MKVTATRLFAVLTDLAANIVDSASIGLVKPTADAVVDGIEILLGRLASSSTTGTFSGVGVTVSGDVDAVSGIVRDSPLMGATRFTFELPGHCRPSLS